MSPNLPGAGWSPCARRTGWWCWTLAQATAPRTSCAKWARRSMKKSSPRGGLTWRATARWNWRRRRPIFASAPIWTKCSTRAGVRRWRRHGRKTPGGRAIAIHGTSTRTARKAWCSGRTRFMRGTVSAGCIRCMRCWPTNGRTTRRYWPRAYSSTTAPIRPSPARSICHCWNCR